MFYWLRQQASTPEPGGRSEDMAQTQDRVQTIIFLSLVVLTIFVSLWRFNSFQLGTWHDDANYYVLTRSLLESDTYGQNNTPGEPTVARYPFGYPLLLAPVMAIFPDNVDILKVLSLVTTLANAAILFWGWRWFSDKSRWWALGVIGLYLLAPLTLEHTRMVMAEPFFTLFLLVAMIGAERAVKQQDRRYWPIIMGVCLFFIAFTRTIGIVMAGGLAAYLFLHRRFSIWKQVVLMLLTFAVLLTAVLFLTPVQPSSGLLPERYLNGVNASFLNTIRSVFVRDLELEETLSERYVVEDDTGEQGTVDRRTLLADYLEGVNYHLRQDLRLAVIQAGGGDRERDLAERIGIPWLPEAFGYAVSLIVFVGFAWEWWQTRRLSSFNLFAAFYLAVLSIWVWEGPRLLYPILPQLFFGFFLGIEAFLMAGVWLTKQTRRDYVVYRLLAVLVVLLMGLHVFKDMTEQDSVFHVGDLRARSQWIAENTEAGAIVLSEDVLVDYIYSNRKTVEFPETVESIAALDTYLSDNEVDYVLLTSRRQWSDYGYSPVYSPHSNALMALLFEMEEMGQARLVHSVDENLVKVFRITQR